MIKKLFIFILCLFPLVAGATKMTDFTEDTSPTSDDIFWTTNDPSGSPADRKVSLGNLLLFFATQDMTLTGTFVNTKVNAAGGSADVLTLSGTLGIMDGSDTFRGIYLNYANADHTGSSNTVQGIAIPTITGDAEATETGIYIGAGWDYSGYFLSPLLLGGNATSTKGILYLYDLDNSAYVAITPADETTSWKMVLPASEPTGLLRADAGTVSTTTSISGTTISGGTASTVAAWDGSQNLTSLSSQNVVTTGYVDGAVKVTVSSSTPVTVSGSSGFYFNGSDSAKVFTLPAASAGLAYCFANDLYAKTITVDPAAGDQIILDGVVAAAAEHVISGGAVTDMLCVLARDSTYWRVTSKTGTWTEETPP